MNPMKVNKIDPKLAIIAAKNRGYEKGATRPRESKYKLRFEKEGTATVDVFYTTGTIGTYLYHPKWKKRTQLYRRNMTLADLEKILDNPRVHTGEGYFERDGKGRKVWIKSGGSVNIAVQFDDGDTMEKAKIPDDLQDKIKSTTIGVNTFVVLFNDGKTWTGPHIPQKLFNKLFRRTVRGLPPVDIVELSRRSDQSYFVQFADGKQMWHDLPEELEKILEEDNSGVDVIAIGSVNDFYVQLKDGTVRYNNLPPDLTSFIQSRKPNQPHIIRVSLAEDGNWAVQLSTGKWRWSDYNNNKIEEKIDNKKMIKNIAYGGGDDYIVAYIE